MTCVDNVYLWLIKKKMFHHNNLKFYQSSCIIGEFNGWTVQIDNFDILL